MGHQWFFSYPRCRAKCHPGQEGVLPGIRREATFPCERARNVPPERTPGLSSDSGGFPQALWQDVAGGRHVRSQRVADNLYSAWTICPLISMSKLSTVMWDMVHSWQGGYAWPQAAGRGPGETTRDYGTRREGEPMQRPCGFAQRVCPTYATANCMAEIGIFHGLDAEEKTRVRQMTRKEIRSKGETIFTAGA